MLLIVEIVLTILNWKRWKWYSLIPVGCCFGMGFMIGLSNPSAANNLGSVVWVDVLAIIALIVMLIVKPKPKLEDTVGV